MTKRIVWLALALLLDAAHLQAQTPVISRGRTSTANASTTPLGSSATFTGTWEDSRDYNLVTVSVFANQNSASSGWKLQWSSDATNVDVEDLYTVTASTGQSQTSVNKARYFRTVYINGGSAQATFRLATVFRQSGTTPSSSAAGLTDTQLRATPVPVSGTVTVTDGAGALNTIVDSGSITANAGTNLNTSALALDATLTGGTQKTKIVDTGGTNVASVSAGGAVKVDGSAATQPVSGTVTVTDGAGALNTIVDSGTITAVTAITNALPAGNNNIGDVDVATLPSVTIGTFPDNEPFNIAQIAGATPSVTNTLPIRQSDGTGFLKSDVIAGNRYLGVSTVQDIEVSASNSSTANLASAASFTGTSQTTLGAGAIQVVFFADQNFTLQVQQSQEDPGVNWNVVDSWTYTANSTGVDAARTIQAVASSVRVVATNNGGSTTTVLRLQTVICPICDALPRGLTQLGNLKTALVEAIPAGTNVVGALTANQSVNAAQIGGTNTVNGGLAGSLAVGGTAGNNAAITQNPFVLALEARSSGPTVATNGNQIRSAGDLAGNQYNVYPLTWSCALDNIAATLTECKAAAAAGYSHYVTGVFAQSTTATAATFAIRSGTGTNCGTGTAGVLPGASTSRTYVLPANTAAAFMFTSTSGIKLTAAHAVCAIGAATNTLNITIMGYTAP